MGPDLTVLTFNAAAVALIHTAIGPDHYLPFIVLSKARNWSMAKTAWITFACGLGHVASSVVLGMVGYAVGASLHRLEWIESVRGGVTAPGVSSVLAHSMRPGDCGACTAPRPTDTPMII